MIKLLFIEWVHLELKCTAILPRTLSWTNEPFDVLGINIKRDSILDANYNKILEKSTEICNSWENRNLSLYGKVLVIKHVNYTITCTQNNGVTKHVSGIYKQSQ